jgi:uncharacterized phage protein (TIGR02220 family)
MARGRILAGQISYSPSVNDMSLKAAFLFSWIIPHLDDFGKISGEPRKIKAQVVPMKKEIDESEIGELLMEMKGEKLIEIYWVDNSKNSGIFIKFNGFEKHQTGLHKRTNSKFPDPEEGEDYSFSGKFREIPGNSGLREEKRREEKRRESLELPEGNSLSDKSDISPQFVQKLTKNTELKAQAREVLEFLNEKAGRAFRPVDATLKPIISRLKSGVTVQDCKTIIVRKHREWKSNPEMETYLRPKTLFNATNFEQYLGECVVAPELQGGADE